MKTSPVKILALLWLAAATFGLTAFINKKNLTAKATAEGKGFAVVELFTSEGCSSCPPADEVVAKIQRESANKPVYILAFHVDYWNRLGWKDIFSSADYSRRQNQYAAWLHLQSVYTPQVVVNGGKEFVGSEEGTLRNTIKADLQQSASAQLSLSDVKANGGKAGVQFHADGNISNKVLLLAVVEKAATSKVERGENGGRTLSHVQIVRTLTSLPLKTGSGNVSVALPKGFTAQGYELIAFLQDQSTGSISAATRAAF